MNPDNDAANHYQFGELTISKITLDNGMRVLLMPDHSAAVISLQLWYGVGSRHETPGKTGIAHLFEHLMFNQTEHVPAGEFDRLMEAAGGDTNAATWVDWTYYRDSLPADQLDLALRLEAERMQYLTLEDAQVESEREVVTNERRYRVDDDVDGFLGEQLFATAFDKHPYHWPTIGWMNDIQQLSIDDCRNFYKSCYAPNNATLVLVGDFDTAQARARLEELFLPIAKSDLLHLAVAPPPEPEQTEERRKEFAKPTTIEHSLIAYKAPGQGDPDWVALEMLNEILLGSASSPGYRRLVVDEEMASGVSGYVTPFRDPGLYEIAITAKRGRRALEAEAILMDEIQKLKNTPPSTAQMQKARSRLETSFWSAMETADGKAEALGHYETTLGDYRRLFAIADRMQTLAAEDITRVANRYLQPTQRTVVTAIPDGEQ